MPAFFGGRGGRGPGFKPKPPADPHAKIAELAKLTCESPPFGTPAPRCTDYSGNRWVTIGKFAPSAMAATLRAAV